MKKLLSILLVLALAGCAAVNKMETGPQNIGERLVVTLEGAWNHVAAPGLALGPGQVWTMEGLPVDQLRIYAALQAARIPFAARIVGEGPLRPELEKLAGHLGIAANVTFTRYLPQHEVWNQLAWADVLLHTGVIAPSGDRDGLPNVIPEAMSVGVLSIPPPAHL